MFSGVTCRRTLRRKSAQLPALDGGTLTLTSCNNFAKVTPDVQRLWAAVLLAIPNSRLIMQTTAVAGEYTKKVVTERFVQQGVSSNRLEFRGSTDFPIYLKLLERSDMTLDPYPFNGGTTTCHSLWMGAPVVTLAGDRHASRMGLSMMTAIGLPEFVAHTPEEYVAIAKTFAADLPRLSAILRGDEGVPQCVASSRCKGLHTQPGIRISQGVASMVPGVIGPIRWQIDG